jgi:hypothetical protein
MALGLWEHSPPLHIALSLTWGEWHGDEDSYEAGGQGTLGWADLDGTLPRSRLTPAPGLSP